MPETLETPEPLEEMDPSQEEDLSLTQMANRLLHEVKSQRIKVLVRMTNKKNLLGFIEEYDRAWNLLMTNVLELWTKKRGKDLPPG